MQRDNFPLNLRRKYNEKASLRKLQALSETEFNQMVTRRLEIKLTHIFGLNETSGKKEGETIYGKKYIDIKGFLRNLAIPLYTLWLGDGWGVGERSYVEICNRKNVCRHFSSLYRNNSQYHIFNFQNSCFWGIPSERHRKSTIDVYPTLKLLSAWIFALFQLPCFLATNCPNTPQIGTQFSKRFVWDE